MWEWLDIRSRCRCSRNRLLKGPDLQTVDVEVLLGRQWLVVKGGAFGGGSSEQLSIQPQAQLTTAQEE